MVKFLQENFVDDNGCYTTGVGAPLQGLSVLEEGSKVVTEVLSSDILLTEKYSHSYPYDWRTNKPVIIKASSQWFIDTTQLKDKAIVSTLCFFLKHVLKNFFFLLVLKATTC